MKYTSAEAAKLVAKLQQEHMNVLSLEKQSRTFLASVGEDVESVRPEYNYEKTKIHLLTLERKIRKVKHAINVFNAKTVIPEFDMTIDEMLVYIPQLTKKKDKLKEMANALPKTRSDEYPMSNIIDYRYANYDLKKARNDLEAITEELSKAQLALDSVNHTITFEIEE
ncbi:MAG: hypothetical protein K6G64_04220 [Eubacterium sp.]|nr:hypothetical protein [Eubacterium sp.]